ncbi:MAG: (2Fe-2S)-binding protein [Sphingomonadaceae bacterium]
MTKNVSLRVNGRQVSVEPGTTVAAAIAHAGNGATRRSVSGMLRAPLCGMGVCQECRVQIDGREHQLACQTLSAEGMEVSTV